MTISTHVLDLAAGSPGAGVAVTCERSDGRQWVRVGGGATDERGRVDRLIADTDFTSGTFRLTFETGRYFAARNVACFYPTITIEFTVADAAQHYHVPLLLSPFGYSTYRGS